MEEKYVEDGDYYEKGRAYPPAVQHRHRAEYLVTQQTSVYTLLPNMRIASSTAQQNTVSKMNQMTDVESLLREAEGVYNLDKRSL